MNAKRGIVLIVTVTALTHIAGPAWAVTQDQCTESFGGSLEGEGEYPVCVFAIESVEQCDAAEGLPTEAEDACLLPVESVE